MASPRFPQTDTAAPPPQKPPQAPPVIDASNPAYVPQPQYEPGNITQPIPDYTVTQTISPEGTKKPQDFNWSNRQHVEDWLNGLKPGFYKYLADKQLEAATSNVRLVEHLYAYLTLYKGEIVGEYLSEGAMEMIFSALGPIGNLWRSGYGKNLEWKMAWMKNPLNPDALYYYLKALPERKAFEIALLPVEKAMAILAKGGGPFTLSTYQDGYGHIQQKYIFTPLLRATQAAHIAADGIDKLAGFSSNTFDPSDARDRQSWNEDNSPWKQDMNKTNKNFHEALQNLKTAKLSRDKTAIKTADQKLKFLLDKYDGWYHEDSSLSTGRKTVYAGAGISRALLKHLYSNTARRLRSTERDPISYFLSLFGGAIWDLTLGLILNTAKTAVSQAINLIPGARILRAQMTEFITGDKFLSNASIGGSSLKSIIQGVFTPATASFGYTGYRALSALFPNASISQIYNPFTNSIINLAIPLNPAGIMGSALVGSAGIFYNVALKMAASNSHYYWTSQYQNYLSKGTLGNEMINKNYFKGFKPGPLSNFAKFLAEHPLVRIPINGLVIGDLISPLMQQYYGWNPWLTRGVFAGADWLLQTRRTWAKLLTRDSFYIKARTFKFFGKSFQLFGRTYYTPFFRMFSLNNPNSFGFKLYQKYLNVFYTNTQNVMFSAGITERPWFSWTKKNILSPAQPYIRNFFNPGFFLGFGLVPLLTPALGGWAILYGPLAGSAAWQLATRAAAAAIKMPYAEFAATFNPLAYSGFFISQLTGLAIFGTSIPFWYTAAWTVGLPLLGMPFSIIASMANISVTTLLANIISGITSGWITVVQATAGIATSMAVWATAISVSLVGGLTIFFAYTVYAGFWVPMIEKGNAQPQSSNFSINTNCQLTAPNQYNCCSNFSLTENVLNDLDYLLHETDIGGTDLSIDLTDPAQTTDAFRNSNALNYEPGGFSVFGSMNVNPTNNLYTITNTTSAINGSGSTGTSNLVTLLSVPDELPQNLFELMQTNSSVVFSMQPLFDILTKLAEEFGKTKHLVLEYEAQITLLEHQKSLLEKLIDQLETNLTSNNLVFSLTQTLASLETAAANNPLTDPCPPNTTNSCTPEQQGLKDLYNSWPNLVQQYPSSIEGFLTQAQAPAADPVAIKASLQTYLDTLTDLPGEIGTQITNLNNIKNQIETAQGKMNAAEAAKILATNFLSFSNLTEAEQKDIWDNFLKKFFPQVFDESRTFYFIPQGTNYQVCVDTTYTGSTPATPQTVCSTISYTPSVWGPNTAFAKSCTTFTPQ